jgi:hypothetical protein
VEGFRKTVKNLVSIASVLAEILTKHLVITNLKKGKPGVFPSSGCLEEN